MRMSYLFCSPLTPSLSRRERALKGHLAPLKSEEYFYTDYSRTFDNRALYV